jgi:putative peptide zinc metalloprotease protein
MQDCLKLKEECRFYPYDGGHGKEEFIIRTPDNRQFKISTLARDILQRLDGKTSLEEISSSLRGCSVSLSPEQLRHMVETQYAKMGILVKPGAPEHVENYGRTRKRIGFPLLLNWELIPQQLVVPVSTRLVFLYSPLAFLPSLFLIIATHYLVYFRYGAPEYLSNAGAVPVLLLSLLGILCHEFGHAAAVSRYGGTPGMIGFALYLLMPSFFADVSEIWRFPRRQRMIVDLGGVYFQQVTFVVFALLGILTAAPEYFVACHFIDLMVLITLNPVFRFDGYWFLVDFLGLPNLYQSALSYVRSSFRSLFFGTDASHDLPRMSRYRHLCFLVYALLCNLFLLAAVWFSCRYLYLTLTRFPRLFDHLFRSMAFAFETHDLSLFLNRLITLFFVIAFPATAALGLGIYIYKMTRYGMIKIRSLTR